MSTQQPDDLSISQTGGLEVAMVVQQLTIPQLESDTNGSVTGSDVASQPPGHALTTADVATAHAAAANR
jgi:hypothetical protein